MTTTTGYNSSHEPVLMSAESVIMHKGFSGTSIDDIIDRASITRGGFLYRFDGKPELAEALMQRYPEQDGGIFNGLFDEANEHSEDPLQHLLTFLKLLAQSQAMFNEGT
jgi:TetR/AcrR family transcriptional repressor of nem operon